MTDAINYIQSLFSLNNFNPVVTTSRHDSKLVKSLIKDAKEIVAVAEAEEVHGITAQKLIRQSDNIQLQRNMTTIAIWHFERSFEKYQKAAARYSEAGRIQTKQSKIFFAEAREMARRADEAAVALSYLNESLKQN